MKKVVYSISKLNRFGNNKMTGVGFITESDLVIACVSQKGNPYIRVFEDCVKSCHAIPNRDGEYKGVHAGIDSDAIHKQDLPEYTEKVYN